ncbi:neo-calmodulin-like [Saccoglossus kowalevskii]|uniref:Calmodulin-like n=1 Tax=Saccoglossus kowalevskii TaxID=10224 RepID=A0ABM0MJK4_SACKO|nr:PREDICTED: calmodulin-like [Saccoglossus kowalevskii]
MDIYGPVSPSKTGDLTEKQISRLKETFTLFDKDGDGAITVGELKTILRTTGPLITEAELNNIIENRKDVAFPKSDTVQFVEFLTIMATRMTDREYSDKEIVKSFRVFRKLESKYIKTSEIKHVLTTVGETLSHEEIDELIKDLDKDNEGVIKYEDFVSALT